MPISLDKPMAPGIKLQTPGQYINGHVCDVAVVPLYEFGSQRVKLNQNGRERTQEKVTLLVTGGTAVIKAGEGYRPVAAGEEVVVWLNAGRRWAWIEAKRKAGGLDVGDVVQIVYKGDEQGQGASPRKVWTVAIRKPEEKDGDGPKRAEAIYHRLRAEAPKDPRAEQVEDDYPDQMDDFNIPF